MKITIAVSTYNSASTIAACVESLLAIEYPDKEIIIVDDGSTDDTLQILQKYGFVIASEARQSRLIVIHQNHAGVSAGRDNVFRNATGELIAYTDSDCEVDKSWIKELIQPFSDTQIGAVTGKTIFRTDNRCTSWLRSIDIEERYNQRKTYTSLANGTNCVFRKQVLEQIGGFNPEWFHAEDTEVSYQILKSGLKIYYQPSAVVRHVPEGDWRAYLKKRFRGTKAHLRIMPKHTGDVIKDDFVSLKMLLQPAFYTLFIVLFILGIILIVPQSMGIPIYLSWIFLGSSLCLVLGLLLEIPLIVQVLIKSKNPVFLFTSILLLLGKSIAIGMGVLVGLVEYRILNSKNGQ